MVEDAYHAARVFGNSLLLLDRYFLTVPVLETLTSLNGSGDVRMEIVTKAKKSCTAFEKPGPRKPGRGRPPKKGAAVRWKVLFVSHAAEFQEAEAELYGKKESIRHYCIDLLWGQKLYQELRFVLVEVKGAQSILACTNLELDPLAMIRLTATAFGLNTPFGNSNSRQAHSVTTSGQSICQNWAITRRKGILRPWSRRRMKNPVKKCWGQYVPWRCIWPYPALQWGSCRAFLCVLLERSVPASSDTRGPLPKAGCQKPPSCIICGNIFYTFWEKHPNYA